MNRVKIKGLELEVILMEIGSHIDRQRIETLELSPQTPEAAQAKVDELRRQKDAEPARWLSLARTDLQRGLMELTRAVAQPTSF